LPLAVIALRLGEATAGLFKVPFSGTSSAFGELGCTLYGPADGVGSTGVRRYIAFC
jgi:hypothetical protein